MKQQLSQRAEFQQAFFCYTSDTPTADIPQSVKEFHVNLLREEVRELEVAAAENDVVGVLDAISDTLYALLGASFSFGLADVLELAFDAVHASNMSKLGADGKPLVRKGDGKFLKGPDYFSPRLTEVLFPTAPTQAQAREARG